MRATDFELAGTGKVIGGKGEAGNLYRLLRHMFRKALVWSMRPRELGNPIETVAEPKVARRERLLTGSEIGALLRALDTATEPPQIVALIRAAILTGARATELSGLRWDYVRRDEMELRLPDTKSGHSVRPLSAETLAVFDDVGRMPGSPFVFRAVENPKAPLSYHTVEKAFRRIIAGAGVKNCTLHTIRHWFATMTANSVSNPRVGMALTGHKSHTAYMTTFTAIRPKPEPDRGEFLGSDTIEYLIPDAVIQGLARSKPMRWQRHVHRRLDVGENLVGGAF